MEMSESNVMRDGDQGFRGVDMRENAGPEFVALARNCRFGERKIATRKGVVTMPWTHRVGAFWPWVWPVAWTNTLPFASVAGAGKFEDPDGLEWFFVAGTVSPGGAVKVFCGRPNNTLSEVALSEALAGDEVEFVQANSELYLFQGSAGAPMVLRDVNLGFVSVELAASEAGNGTGTQAIPNGATGLFFQNRMFIPHGRDLVGVSDALNMTRYAAATRTFRINQGSSDALVGLYKFNETSVVCAKDSSVYVVTGLVPDAAGNYASAVLDEVTRSWGFIARRSVVACGADLIGLSQKGVMSLRQTEFNKLQAVDVPLSAAVQGLIDGINWRHASGACGAYWENRYYLAVPWGAAEIERNEMVWDTAEFNAFGQCRVNGFEPGREYRVTFGVNDTSLINGGTTITGALGKVVDIVAETDYVTVAGAAEDGVTASIVEVFKGVNNRVLVYDFERGAWAGYDDGEGLMPVAFFTFDYQGKERLFFWSADGFLRMYEEGEFDQVFRWGGWPEPLGAVTLTQGLEEADVVTEVLMRHLGRQALSSDGFHRAPLGEKRNVDLTLALRGWSPRYSIYERPNGVNEEVALVEARTWSRTNYFRPWDRAAWDPANEADDHGEPYREDYSVVLPADGMALGSGVVLNLHQERLEKVRLRGRGERSQVRIYNDRGRVEILAAEVGMGAGVGRMGTV